MSLAAQIQQHLSKGELAQARPLLERAARTSTDPQLLLTFARVLQALGEKEPAAYQASRALTVAAHSPHDAQIRIIVGELMQACNKPLESVRIFREGIARCPQLPNFRAGLINALRAAGHSGEAGDEALRALAMFPNDILIHLIGAGALGDSLRQSAARDALLRAVALAPADPRVLVPAATMLHYCDGIPPAQLTEFHRRAGEALSRSVGPAWQPANWDFNSSRRPRIALVSCDFRDHAVARFLESWLAHRDRADFEYIGVSLLGPADETTARLRAYCDSWLDVAGKPDDQIISLIREAKPDIAIDLSGLHVTARPAVFARRVAPIQITYLGYAGTTGIPAMDYRLVDEVTDPPGAESLSTEKLLRLNGSFLCFSPDPRTPELSSTAQPGELTFCSFNAQQKITDTTLTLWAHVLHAVPHAKLLLKSRTLSDPRTREILNTAFAARAIDPARIEVAPHSPDYRTHLETYNRADIALDTHPYCGTTTTCEALAMGLPVLTLIGNSHASRVGASLLTTAGFAAEVVTSTDQLGHQAAQLANVIFTQNASERVVSRRSRRSRFLSSPACNAPAFATAISDLLLKLAIQD